MSNLPINNAVSMNQNYLPQEREMPAADKSRDPLLSKVFTNSVVLDNGAAQKHGNVMVNRDALERLFDMFESAIRAIRSMLAGHDVMPKSLPDTGALKKTLPESGPDSTLNPDKALKPLPKAGSELKTAPEADPKAQILSDIAKKMLPNAGAQPQVPASSTDKSKSSADPQPANTPAGAPVKSGDAKVDEKKLSEIVSKALPDASVQPQVSSPIKPQSTLPANEADKPIKPDAKSFSEIAAKALQDARMRAKVTPEAKSQTQVSPDADFKARPEAQPLTKTLHHDAPGVRFDSAQQNKQTSDINVTVQVVNCGFHHPEANFISHRRSTPRFDDQPTLIVNTPHETKVDGETKVKSNTPEQRQADSKTTVKSNTPEQRQADGETKVKSNTPEQRQADGETKVKSNTPEQRQADGETKVKSNTPEQRQADGETKVKSNTPEQRQADGKTTVNSNTPEPRQAEGETKVKSNTPESRQAEGGTTVKSPTADQPTVDGRPTLTVNTPNNPGALSESVNPAIKGQPPVATPATDTASTGPLPSFKPENRPKLDLTAAGPADDHSADIFNSRNRTRFDNARASSAGRQPRA